MYIEVCTRCSTCRSHTKQSIPHEVRWHGELIANVVGEEASWDSKGSEMGGVETSDTTHHHTHC